MSASHDWHRNTISGETAETNIHWSRLNDFDYGDIKLIWGPSRFGFVYTLVRAYWRTGDEKYAEFFWDILDDWMRANQPNQGVNWKCGQEVSIRVMALCFGLHGFLDSPHTTTQRINQLSELMLVSGQRIEANIGYALSQKNNHGISEAMGLWTIGILFPEFERSEIWKAKGGKYLEKQARELIYDDGSFSQHSFNYERLMLHDYIWAIRLGELNGCPLSDELIERVGLAAKFLYQMQDQSTGRLPLCGANDGSLILPINNCDYHDFRPVIQAAYYLCYKTLCYEPGPWDEDVLWLFGPDALNAPREAPIRLDFSAPNGGYYVLRSENSHVMIRCPAKFKHRPSHADLLHVDLWHKGVNIAIDPGTYSYNAEAPWDDAFSSALYHNTVTVDGKDQMEKFSRFLYLPWAEGKVIKPVTRSADGKFVSFEGCHKGYRKLKGRVDHNRAVYGLEKDTWVIVDNLTSKRDHDYRLHWLFLDCPYMWYEQTLNLILETEAGKYYASFASSSEAIRPEIVVAAENNKRGWRSPNYMALEPAISFSLNAVGSNVRFVSVLGPERVRIVLDDEELLVEGNGWRRFVIPA